MCILAQAPAVRMTIIASSDKGCHQVPSGSPVVRESPTQTRHHVWQGSHATDIVIAFQS